MTEETTGISDPQDREMNESLARDLEVLYRNVAAQDTPDAGNIDFLDLDSNYEVLQVAPGASLAEIHQAYARMIEAWRADRYPHVELWEEKSARKRKEIKKAYDNLLIIHSSPPANPPEDRTPDPENIAAAHMESFPADEHTVPFSDTEASSSADAPAAAPELKSPPLRTGRILWIIPAALLLAALSSLFFFWPDLYHYETLNVGESYFPLRIHRITGETSYFNGKEWTKPPLKMAGATAPAPPATAAAGKPAAPPVLEFNSEERAQPPATTPPPRQAAMKAEPIPGVKPTPGIYRVQLMAYPDRERATALLKKVKSKYLQATIEEVQLSGKGAWYRILVGEFSDPREARRFMLEEDFPKRFPGSFVQRSINKP